MTQSGIEPATFRFVAQHLNYCTTTVPIRILIFKYLLRELCIFKYFTITVVIKCDSFDMTGPEISLII